MWRDFLPTFFFCFLGLVQLISAICPQMCICDIDDLGRKRIRCEDGGVNIPGNLDINSLDQDTEVLIVTGSWQRPNAFSLTPNMFQNKRFKEIHLSFSQMDLIGDRTFSHISNSLLVLNLTHNDLRTMTKNNFRNITRLTHLHLDHNSITSVHSTMFSYLTSLKVLTISNNLINDVPPRMGIQLAKLEVLDMSNNPIGLSIIENIKQIIPEVFFQDFPNLRILNLANTSLDSLPWLAIQRNNFKLEELDMSDNKIQEIQLNQVSFIHKLRRLRLANNPIQVIAPCAFAGLLLENLDLSGLSAQHIFQLGVFQGAKIQQLDLSFTGLTKFRQEVFLPISQYLNSLDLSGNPDLIIEPRTFMVLPQLQALSMGGLLKMNLSDDLFDYHNNLAYLDLSENGLEYLEDKFFSCLTDLETLILVGNKLKSIPTIFDTNSLPKIAEIDLSRNQLSNFPDNLVNTFLFADSRLRSLKLNGNPWKCDCGVASLERWLVNQYRNQGYPVVCIGSGNFTCPTCFEPAGLRGTPLNMLPPQFLEACVSADKTISSPNYVSSTNICSSLHVFSCLQLSNFFIWLGVIRWLRSSLSRIVIS